MAKRKCVICGNYYRFLGKHVRSHGLSDKEYYDKYLRIKDDGICHVCYRPTKFLGLTKGYASTCSLSCASKHGWNDELRRLNHSERNSLLNKERFDNDPEYKASILSNLSSKESEAKSHLNRALKLCSKWMLMYIIISDTWIKIGIAQDMKRFKNKSGRASNDYMLWKCESDPSRIPNLEYKIKVNYKPSRGSEYFDKSLLNEFIQLIDSELDRIK